jgi:hypothetical protein
MWLRFLRDFDWTMPSDRRVSFAYRGGCTYFVKRAWAEAMVAKGVAVRTVRPAQPEPAVSE